MTSRFGKTYNRKGGEANSKFEEVFSNKKPSLSTKWGETTYKAQLGGKRPLLNADDSDATKRPKLDDSDIEDDPFGFDSDDESQTVTSYSVPPAKVAELIVATPTPVADSNVVTTVTPALSSTSSTVTFTIKQAETAVQNNQLWYKAVSDPNQNSSLAPPSSNTTTHYKDQTFSLTQRFVPTSSTVDTSVLLITEAPSGSKDPQTSSCYGDQLIVLNIEGSEPATVTPPALVEIIPPSPFTLRASNCKKYQRPSRYNLQSSESLQNDGDNKPTDPTSSQDKLNNVVPVTVAAIAPAAPAAAATTAKPAAKPVGRGGGARVRDYTVLHPSCQSVCNVTIQDSIERTMDDLVSPVAPSDVGEAGKMKKKSDVPAPKPSRFRPTQTKTKKTKSKTESKLEFFGFEEEGDQGSEEGSEGHKSSYKIKYFGFDDLSESDSDDESCEAKEKKAKKTAAALAALSSSVDSPHTSDSQDSQASSSTEAFDFSDDSSPGGTDVQKARSGKSGDKSKDACSGLKKIFSGPKKSPAKAVYNARHWNQPEPKEMPVPLLSRSQTAPAILSSSSSSSSSKDSNSHNDDGLFKAPPPPPKVIKTETMPTRLNQDIVTALKCRKQDKELYTVVQHVKHFNDVVEFGENQEFTDDFEYLETGLKSSQPLNTRCLSVISLAARCAMPSFRMHLRARGKVAQVFKMLSDAPQHPNLALCTASLMYILSRDRLNMDLDRACLELMIKLLEMDHDCSEGQEQLTAKEVGKVKEKIRKLCETVHNKHLDLENIITGHLAMETLLSLTSKRAGDWFKEELRLLGGLDHIVDKVKECALNLSQEDDKESLVASLWGAERCLRVLESVTVQNPENQGYLIAYKDSELIISTARALRYCEDMIQRYSRALNNSSVSLSSAALPHCNFSNVGKAVEDCMRAVIGVLLNLTHDNEWGSTKTGEQDQLILTALNCVLQVPRYIPQEQRFDVRVLGLGLLINLVEYSSRNRHYLVDMEYIIDDTCLEDSLMQLTEPAQLDPAQLDPAQLDPAQLDPAQLDPAQLDPAQLDPAQLDPAQLDPAQLDPAQSDPAQLDPAQLDPAQLDPAQLDPAQLDPAQLDPAQSDPAQSDPAQSEPAQPDPIQPEPAQSDTAAKSMPQSTAETERDGTDESKSSGALAALVKFFLERERAAILAEAKTDNIITEAPKPALDKSGEWQETSGEIQWVAAEPNENQTEKKEEEKEEEEDQELDLNKALQHAGKHMEDSIVASYTALLLGCLCQGSQINVTTVRQHLPKGDFSIMTEMLKKFLSFMNLTCAMGTTGQKSISRVIDYLEHC